MQRPTLMPSKVHDETFGGVTYHLEGELVPALTIEVTPDAPVYFEHHILLWKSPDVQIGIRAMKGALKRMIAGMQVLLTEARGSGQIAFSRDGVGHVVPIHLRHGEGLVVREHQFLAATSSVEYSFRRVKGISNLLFGGSGFFIDEFAATGGDGIVWLHGYGNVFEKVLAPGEQIDVEPGGWVYHDPDVRMETTLVSLASGLFGGNSLTFNRFTGPGRVGLQSMYVHLPTES